MKSTSLGFLSMTLFSLVACSSTVTDDDGGEGGGTTTHGSTTNGDTTGNGTPQSTTGVGPTTTGGPSSSTGMVTQPPQGLYDCEDLPLACASVFFHTYPQPLEGYECVARLALSGEPGAARGTYSPGPYLNESETLAIYRGDGKAIVQRRHRSCMQNCPDPVLWEASAVQLCDVVVSEQVQAACEADENCGTMPSDTLANCVDIAEPTCAEVAAIVAPAE